MRFKEIACKMRECFTLILSGLIICGLLMLASISPTEAGEWTEKTRMPTARHFHRSSVVNGRIYAIGGQGPGGWGPDVVEEYDPVKDEWKGWEEKAAIPTLRYDFSTSAVNGSIYAIGGWDVWAMPDRIFLSAVEEYDPATDTWTTKADMPTDRGLLCSSAVNGRIYAMGGWNWRPGITPDVEEYDPVTDTWTKKSDMPRSRYNFSTSVMDGKIYAIGGFTGGGFTPVRWVEEYDPVTDTWTKKNDMPMPPRGYHSAAVVDGRIYVIGGAIGKGSALSTVEIYDPVTDTWEEGLDMPTARKLLSANAVNGKIYAIGGSTAAGVPLSTVEEYDPESVAVEPRGKLATTWGEVKCD